MIVALRPLSGLLQFTMRGLGLSLAVAAVLAAAAPAHATGVQFATFTQTTGSPFSFSNNATAATFSTTAATNINFAFTAASGQDTSARSATLSLSSTTTATARSATFGGSTFVDQNINGANNVLSIRDNATGRNLLTLTFTGDITGQAGSSNANLAGDSAVGNTVTYTSDFVSLGSTGSFLIGLPTIAPPLSAVPGSFLTSFITDALGSFSDTSVAAVPQPASVAMFGTGLVATALLLARRRLAVRRPALV